MALVNQMQANPMRQVRYGPIATNPTPVPSAMPGQVPDGFPPNMQVNPSPVASPAAPIVQQPQMQQPQAKDMQAQQLMNMQTASNKISPKPRQNDKTVLDKNQMQGAISRRMKGGV